MNTLETTDIYKAAYFILYGAELKGLRIKHVAENKRKKIGISRLYVMEIINIPDFAIQCWNTGQAYGNIVEYARVRWRLKEKLHQMKEQLYALS